MSSRYINKALLEQGFDALGKRITDNITITVAGSAMFLLRNAISRDVGDCDLVLIEPSEKAQLLLAKAAEVSGLLGLQEDWLNTAMTDWEDYANFPHGWQQRATDYSTFGRLKVRCISSADALALKAMTTQERGDREGHEPDLVDLEGLLVSDADVDFTINYLNGLDSDYSRIIGVLATMKK